MDARSVRLVGCVVAWLAALSFFADWLVADESAPVAQVTRAREQVREALQREVYGLPAEREQLLSAASAADPQAALPRWYRGEIKSADGQWRLADKPVAAAEGRLWREYAALRSEKLDDAESHRALADWCHKHEMPVQERAHLMRSLTLDSKQPELRKRLGLVKVGNQWYEPATVEREERRQKAAKEAHEHWFPILTKLAPQLGSPDERKREAARAQVLAIRDVGALPVLQSVIGVRGEEEQLLVLKVAGALPELDSTYLIAWLAVDSPLAKVRELATHLLKSREPADFVPLLVGEMYSPIETKVESKVLPNGQLALRRSFAREGADHVELFVSDARFVPRATQGRLTGVDPLTYLNFQELQRAASRATAVSDMTVAEQNRLTQLRNERITASLVATTGTNLPAQADAWWNWWLEVNELELPSGKSLVARYQTNQVNVLGVYRRYIMSCFNAGTPVWTDQGPIAIERVRIGDLVLSRDIESGELAYKPVLLTTVRPKRQLTQLTAGNESIQATGGHLFWVSGNGWVRAKELQAGQVLHAAASPVTVVDVQPGNIAETYNLVVDEFHTYFVGQQKLLSHDNTPRRPTRMIVPGLPSE
jgi:hypothetical protein